MRSTRYFSDSLAIVLAISVILAPAFTSATPQVVSARRYRFNRIADVRVPVIPRSWGSAFVDHDRDGWPDLLVGRHLRHPMLFDNRGGAFQKVERKEMGALGYPPPGRPYYDRHTCSWGEANHDGLPDLYCVSGAQKGEGTGPNQLLIQKSDGTLDDQAERYGVVDLYGRGRSLNWVDYDNDGDLDLFVGNELRQGRPNLMFRRDESTFTQVQVGLEHMTSTTTSTWADWDRDGFSDLIVLAHGRRGSQAYKNLGGRFQMTNLPDVTGRQWASAAWDDYNGDGWVDLVLVSHRRLMVLRNARGRFERAYKLPLQQGRGALWLDVENDGDLDLFVVQGSSGKPGSLNRSDFLVLNQGPSFKVARPDSLRGTRHGDGDSGSIADFNRDGRMDVIVTNSYQKGAPGPVQLFANRSRAEHWLGIQLKGGPRNPFGFGARVRVKAGALHYWRDMNDKTNFRSQSDVSSLHLGLGPATSANVKVLWPDGTKDCLTANADAIQELIKGTHPCVLKRANKRVGMESSLHESDHRDDPVAAIPGRDLEGAGDRRARRSGTGGDHALAPVEEGEGSDGSGSSSGSTSDSDNGLPSPGPSPSEGPDMDGDLRRRRE